jgi:adenylate cyclase class 2
VREIEVKAKLRDPEAFLKAAAKRGIKFGPIIEQDDTTYTNKLSYDDPNWNIFRLREQDGKIILTMKHKASTRSRDNHEYETVVSDGAEARKMLERLGFTYDVNLHKCRRIAHYKGLELCFDDIQKLGEFVEIEKLVSEEVDIDAVQTELWGILEGLGVHKDDRTHRGYDTLMRMYLGLKP